MKHKGIWPIVALCTVLCAIGIVVAACPDEQSSDGPTSDGPNTNTCDSGMSDVINTQMCAGVYLSITAFSHSLKDISFNDPPYSFVYLSPGVVDRIRSEVNSLEFEGATFLYDAVWSSVNNFKTNEKSYPNDVSRKIQVVFTDGIDTGSTNALGDLANRYLKDNIRSYVVGVKGSDLGNEADFREGLREIATANDGDVQFIDNLDGLSDAFAGIARDIRSTSSNITIRTPRFSRDTTTLLRWVFDNVADGADSESYIEANYRNENHAEYIIENIKTKTVETETKSAMGQYSEEEGYVTFIIKSVSGISDSTEINLWQSDDEGTSWHKQSEARTEIDSVVTVQSIAVSLVIDKSGSLSDNKNVVVGSVANFVQILSEINTPTAEPTAPDITNSSTTWTPRTSGVSGWLLDVEYANSLWVAVGDGGAILTSVDGATWMRRASGTTARLDALYFGNSLWVAGGVGGVILTSPDGATWTKQTSVRTTSLLETHFANDLWVAVGTAGAIFTSIDGKAWTARSSGVGDHLTGVSYGNSLWVATGYGGVILTSPDGVTWRRRTSGVTGIIGGIYFNEGLWVAGEQGKILTSANGIDWSVGSASAVYLFQPYFANGVWVVTAESGAIFTSTDAMNWTARPLGTTRTIRGIGYGNGAWVVVGYNGTILSTP